MGANNSAADLTCCDDRASVSMATRTRPDLPSSSMDGSNPFGRCCVPNKQSSPNCWSTPFGFIAVLGIWCLLCVAVVGVIPLPSCLAHNLSGVSCSTMHA